MDIRQVFGRVLGMSELAWSMMMGSLKLSAAFLLCAFIIMVDIGSLTTDTYYLYRIALEMARAPISIILTFGLASIILEDYQNRKN